MTQLERVEEWLGGWDNSIYSLNTSGAKYYSFTFDYNSSSAWEGEFDWSMADALNNNHLHVVELSSGRLIK